MLYYHCRQLIRRVGTQKLPGLINIGGLAISLAAVLLILKWVQNEKSFDSYHPESDQIYLLESEALKGKQEQPKSENTPFALAEAIRSGIPGVEVATHMCKLRESELQLRVNNESFAEPTAIYVDGEWFRMFRYNFVAGSAAAFNSDPFSLVITESLAKKLFNSSDATGKIVNIDSSEFTVRGVIADHPANSSFRFEAILPYQSYYSKPGRFTELSDWQYSAVKTFVKLSSNVSPELARRQFNFLVSKHETATNKINLLPLRQMYFTNDFSFTAFRHGERKKVTIFSLLAAILLITSSINYVNFTIAKTSERFKELAVRKINGATRFQIFKLAMAESFINTLIAMIIAIILTLLALPLLKNLDGDVFGAFRFDISYISIIIVLIIAVILMTGIYPAAILSSFRTITLFRGNASQDRNALIRKTLIVIQFSLAVTMIIATIIVQMQLTFIQRQNSAYNQSQVITVKIPESILDKKFRFTANPDHNKAVALAQDNFLATIRQELAMIPEVRNVARLNFTSPVNNNFISGNGIDWNGRPADFNPAYTPFSGDSYLPKILNLKLVAGRWFNVNGQADHKNYILNEAAVKTFGLQEPVIGQRFNSGIVIGVMKDFYHRSMHLPVAPLVYNIGGSNASAFLLEINSGDINNSLAVIKTVWQKHFTRDVFDFVFADAEFQKLYSSDKNFLHVSFIFSGLTIIISSMGLLGLTLLMINRRRKEIGIRKVLGASVNGIIILLSKDYLMLVVIAICIAIPIGSWAMNNWLSNFAYRIELSWWIFGAAAMIGLMTAAITLALQSARAAMINPAATLRNE